MKNIKNKLIASKAPVEKVKKINERIKIYNLKTDNGTEFKNRTVQRWCKSHGIEHEFPVAYYHEDNGRIERANITIRSALNKEYGGIREKVKEFSKIIIRLYTEGLVCVLTRNKREEPFFHFKSSKRVHNGILKTAN